MLSNTTKCFSSNIDKGDDDNGATGGQPRCFTLRSSRRQRPSIRHLQSTESISSDEEDDSFEILTAENLFSTLLSRVIHVLLLTKSKFVYINKTRL